MWTYTCQQVVTRSPVIRPESPDSQPACHVMSREAPRKHLPRVFCCCACNSKNFAASRSVSMLISEKLRRFGNLLGEKALQTIRTWAPRWERSRSEVGATVIGSPVNTRPLTKGSYNKMALKVVTTNKDCNRPPGEKRPPWNARDTRRRKPRVVCTMYGSPFPPT